MGTKVGDPQNPIQIKIILAIHVAGQSMNPEIYPFHILNPDVK